jgi:hypothetical protein
VTAIALANTSIQAGSVGITIRDDTGALVFSSTIALAAQAHTAFVLPNSYGFPTDSQTAGAGAGTLWLFIKRFFLALLCN